MLLCVDGSPAASWEELLDALDAVSPLVDDVRLGLAFLDMHGAAGDPTAWMAYTHAVLRPFEMTCRLGVGSNKITARAAASIADGTVCAAGNERTLLASLPVALLDLEPEIIERLRLLGIERLGDLARLPHGPFVRRFGPKARRWHELARGIDTEPFVPRGRTIAIEASLFGEGDVAEEAQVLFALRLLLAQICSDLNRCGRRAGALQLQVELENATRYEFDVPLAVPTTQERAMLDVTRAKLEGVTFAAPIVGLRLRAGRLEEGGEAAALFASDDFDPQKVAVTLARLEAAVGEPVLRARMRSAHVLEERFVYERFETPKREMFAAPSVAFGEEIVPQLRLLAVTKIDVHLRGGEPAFVGDPPRAVLECAGPWRIDEGWFGSSLVSRDEYDVLLEDGELYRIYRQDSCWYLRGAYD